MLVVTATAGLAGAGFYGLHKPTTGKLIERFVPDWPSRGELVPVVAAPRPDCLEIPDAPARLIQRSAVQLRSADGSICSGSLIGCATVLTAGHCVPDDGSSLSARFVGGPKQTWEAHLVQRHGSMDLATYRIEGLKTCVPDGAAIAPVHRPGSVISPDQANVVIAGSGVTDFDQLDTKQPLPQRFRCGRTVAARRMETYSPAQLDEKRQTITYEHGIALGRPSRYDEHTNSIVTDPAGAMDSALCPGDSGGATWAEVDGCWAIVGVNSIGNCQGGVWGNSVVADVRAEAAQAMLAPAVGRRCE